MKRQYLLYYISRIMLSVILAIVIAGVNWKALLLTIIFFAFFLIFLHSGWFSVDPENKFLPLRRDARGQFIQRKALIASIVLGLVSYFSLSLASIFLGPARISGNIALGVAVVTYFATQFVLFTRTSQFSHHQPKNLPIFFTPIGRWEGLVINNNHIWAFLSRFWQHNQVIFHLDLNTLILN